MNQEFAWLASWMRRSDYSRDGGTPETVEDVEELNLQSVPRGQAGIPKIPAVALWAAVLLDAIDVVMHDARTVADRQQRNTDVDWFLSRDESFGSFMFVCALVGISPEGTLDRLRPRLRPTELSQSALRRRSGGRRSRPWRAIFLRTLAETGSVARSAIAAEVSRGEVGRQRRENPEFAADWAKALDEYGQSTTSQVQEEQNAA